jgi:hypothetical protein
VESWREIIRNGERAYVSEHKDMLLTILRHPQAGGWICELPGGMRIIGRLREVMYVAGLYLGMQK